MGWINRIVRGMSVLPVAVCLMLAAGSATAAWNDECDQLSRRLNSEPATLKVGELDILKSCLSDLQRSIVLGEPLPVQGGGAPSVACAVPPPAPHYCPACPVCAGRSDRDEQEEGTAAVPAKPKSPAPRNREESRSRKPYLPTF